MFIIHILIIHIHYYSNNNHIRYYYHYDSSNNHIHYYFNNTHFEMIIS